MAYSLIVRVDVVRDGVTVKSMTGCRIEYLLSRIMRDGIGLDDEIYVQGVRVARGRVPTVQDVRRVLQRERP